MPDDEGARWATCPNRCGHLKCEEHATRYVDDPFEIDDEHPLAVMGVDLW